MCGRAFSRQDSLARHEKLHLSRKAPSRNSSISDDFVDQAVAPGSQDLNDLSDGFPTVIPNPLEFFSAPALEHLPRPASLEANPEVVSELNTADSHYELMWPDSQDLLQALRRHADPESDVILQGLRGTDPTGNSQLMVLSIAPASITAAMKEASITSDFLDECLHMFFAKFIPTFPILHKATFVPEDWMYPLLFNAMAIGSLYLGPKDAIEKGEALWGQAHMAVSTSWETLLTHRGLHDDCEGIQLMLTCVLSQIYATLSRNRSIRSSSRSFNSLQLIWIRQCGMLDGDPYPLETIPALNSPDFLKEGAWSIWVAREIQQRTLFAFYMLDSLDYDLSRERTSFRRGPSQLSLPSNEPIFEASTAHEWVSHMQCSASVASPKASFESIVRRLFHSSTETRWRDSTISAFSYQVILEGLQSLISDSKLEEDLAEDVPRRSDVRRALNEVYESIKTNTSLSAVDRHETLLRWHAKCLNTIVDPSVLCCVLCETYHITQNVWRTGHRGKSSIDLSTWLSTPAARGALLHAIAIQDIVEQLPRGRSHAIWTPRTLFAAAIIYSAFVLPGHYRTVKVPSTVIWQDVLLEVSPPAPGTCAYSLPPTGVETDTAKYMRGDDSKVGKRWNSSPKNLMYELNSVQKLLGELSRQWGVAGDMEAVVDACIEMTHLDRRGGLRSE